MIQEYGIRDIKKEIDECKTYNDILDIQNYMDIMYASFPDFLEPLCKKLIYFYIKFKISILIRQ